MSEVVLKTRNGDFRSNTNETGTRTNFDKDTADANAGRCGEGESIESSMRPNCLAKDACVAKTPGKHCRRCSFTAIRNDPEVEARRSATYRDRMANDPEFRREHCSASAKRLLEWRKTEQADAMFKAHLGLAKLPEYEAKRRVGISEHHLGWCPDDRRDEYTALRKKLGAKEARRVMEADIPGTEHGKRAVANARLAGRLKHAREQAQAY